MYFKGVFPCALYLVGPRQASILSELWVILNNVMYEYATVVNNFEVETHVT